jgi:gamma-glutamylcyclotransferase (GGCT)/AIG2-like uncharacterized protein YtfP
MKEIIIVYGSLRRFDDNTDTISGYKLYDVKSIKMIRDFSTIRKSNNKNDKVTVSIIKEDLKYTDYIEGCFYEGSKDNLYNRYKITTDSGIEGWIYELNGKGDKETLIKSGDYINR